MTELEGDIRQWGGSYILATASYNAGPHNAEKWVLAFGDPRSPNVDPIDWIRTIPFSETRNSTCSACFENTQVYRNRLAGQDTPLRILPEISIFAEPASHEADSSTSRHARRRHRPQRAHWPPRRRTRSGPEDRQPLARLALSFRNLGRIHFARDLRPRQPLASSTPRTACEVEIHLWSGNEIHAHALPGRIRQTKIAQQRVRRVLSWRRSRTASAHPHQCKPSHTSPSSRGPAPHTHNTLGLAAREGMQEIVERDGLREC